MKIVINLARGYYGIDREAFELYNNISGRNLIVYDYYLIERNDKIFVEVIEKLKHKYNGLYDFLKIVEIPDGCFYKILNNGYGEDLYYSENKIETIEGEGV